MISESNVADNITNCEEPRFQLCLGIINFKNNPPVHVQITWLQTCKQRDASNLNFIAYLFTTYDFYR